MAATRRKQERYEETTFLIIDAQSVKNADIVESLILKGNESKEPKQQGIHIGQPPLSPQLFDPCPRLLYRVEIRAIGRAQHRMPLSLQGFQRVLPLVEGGVVHHHNAARG